MEKLWNFEKEIPYMEKLEFEQNGPTYGRTMEFRFGGKKCVLS